MMRHLQIGADLVLPREAVTETFGYLAARGAGKTNASRVVAEAFFDAGLPFVAVDPVGSWWGLRSDRTGGPSRITIPIFGGKHGDVPLEREAGELVADLVVGRRLSCVLDLSTFESEAAKKKFLLDFAKRLYAKNEEPLHLFLEEADDYIPQRPMREEAHLLRAWENIVRRGRARGLGMTMITQRSASLNKNVLTQVQTLVTMRTTGPQDRAAIEAWLKYNDQSPKILAELPKLANGEAWVWSPNFLKVTKKIRFPLSRTFDSGATPTGTKRAAATLADVDLHAIEKSMAATVEKARAEDPKLLRKRIAELERELAKRLVPVEVRPVYDEAGLDKLDDQITRALQDFRERCLKVNKPNLQAARSVVKLPSLYPDPPPAQIAFASQKMPSGEHKILLVLAQHGTCSKRKVALLSAYAVGGGGFSNLLSSLRTKGWVEGSSELTITRAGHAALGPVDSLPSSRDALLQHWYSQLGKAERLILETLAKVYPRGRTKEQIGTLTGYESAGGGFNNALSRLRTLELIEGRGELRLAEELGDA